LRARRRRDGRIGHTSDELGLRRLTGYRLARSAPLVLPEVDICKLLLKLFPAEPARSTNRLGSSCRRDRCQSWRLVPIAVQVTYGLCRGSTHLPAGVIGTRSFSHGESWYA
jgi:hypothetical protein